MKKLAAIILLSVYLLSTTQLSELLKLPSLIEHYTEHKEAKEDLTFFAFLKIHYSKGDGKYADYDLDTQLPFKSTVNTCMISLAFCATPQAIKFVPKLPVIENVQAVTYQPSFHSSSALSSIWQPPRHC